MRLLCNLLCQNIYYFKQQKTVFPKHLLFSAAIIFVSFFQNISYFKQQQNRFAKTSFIFSGKKNGFAKTSPISSSKKTPTLFHILWEGEGVFMVIKECKKVQTSGGPTLVNGEWGFDGKFDSCFPDCGQPWFRPRLVWPNLCYLCHPLFWSHPLCCGLYSFSCIKVSMVMRSSKFQDDPNFLSHWVNLPLSLVQTYEQRTKLSPQHQQTRGSRQSLGSKLLPSSPLKGAPTPPARSQKPLSKAARGSLAKPPAPHPCISPTKAPEPADKLHIFPTLHSINTRGLDKHGLHSFFNPWRLFARESDTGTRFQFDSTSGWKLIVTTTSG